ncbi:MAG TPA: MFS transporter [Mycobacteriales bacterium]|nr:MFS transporter [Mycobacteriales bacterium]
MTTPPVLPLWRNRDFTLLWSSQVVSTVGTRVTSVAYPLLVLLLTGSPALAGVVGFAQTLPFLLLYLPGGAWVDRWDRRRTMVGCELGRAVALGSVAVTAAVAGVHAVPVAQLAMVAFVEGCLFVLFDLAEGAALPRLVAPEQVPTAVAWNQARTQGADLVGQPAGGALFALAPALPFAVDAISYLVSGGAVAAIRTRLQGELTATPDRLRTRVAEGVRFVARSAYLRETVAIVGWMNLVFNGAFLALIVRARDVGGSPGQIGFMLAAYGAGGVLGALAAPTLHRRLAGRTLLVGIAWIWAAIAVALAVPASLVGLAALVLVMNLFGAPYNVVIAARMYELVPDELLGRVRSVVKIVAWGTIPVGTLLGGVLAEGLSARTALLVLGLGMIPIAIVSTLSPGMRSIGDPVSEPDGQPV